MSTTPAAGGLILIGSEPLRRHLAGRRGSSTLIDCSSGDAADAVRSSGLFGGRLWITGLEHLDEKAAAALRDALLTHGEDFVAQGEKLTAGAARALSGVGDLRRLSISGAAGAPLVQQIAGRLSLSLDQQTVRHLLDRLGHDPGRLVGTLEALGAGGVTRPNGAQIDLLAGSSSEHGLPWELLTHIERGDMGKVRRTLETLDVIPAVGFLAKRALLAQMLVENPDVSSSDIATVLGDVTDAATTQARRLGERLGPEGCRRLVSVLAHADLLAKRSRPREAAALMTGHLSLLLLRAG